MALNNNGENYVIVGHFAEIIPQRDEQTDREMDGQSGPLPRSVEITRGKNDTKSAALNIVWRVRRGFSAALLPREARSVYTCVAYYRHEKVVCLSVRPSVCLSVTLVDCDHVGWKFFEIIPRLVSLGCLLSADLNIITDLLKENTLKFWPSGVWKSDFRCTKALLSLKHGKIRPKFLLITNMKFHARFRLVPKSTILDDLERSLSQSKQHCFFYLFIVSLK